MSIQVMVGQLLHGCSPAPLHLWCPISAADALLPRSPGLYMVVFPITATERGRERGETERMSAACSEQV